jgi:trans-o-hydroxybenzylidenepyruvate hydratase-aldolase
MMTKDEVKGLYSFIPTPAKPGAERWDATDTVDLDELARLTEELIKSGVDGFATMGTTAESATLTEKEWEQACACVVETVRGRVPVFIGTTTLGTYDTVKRTRFVKDIGASGAMIGLPMWQPATLGGAVQLFADMSEALPDFPLMTYWNVGIFRFPFPPPFWVQLVKRAPTVIAAKLFGDFMIDELLEMTQNKIRFVPHCQVAYKHKLLNPDENIAFWSTEAAMGPEPVLALRDALDAHDYETAKAITRDLNYIMETFIPKEGHGEFAKYNIQLEKIRMNEAGYCNAGPIRPPYHVVPKDIEEGGRECGRRWKALRPKYAR